ncbi:hypothetical protein FXW78_22700 [Rhodococcus opacus]|nr:hypothetical protein [Rhodococcus opacus]
MEAASFTERFDFRTLGRLDPDAAERALLEPAIALGVRWAPDAAELALHDAGGSPYLIQYIGDETWTGADPRTGSVIERRAVEDALTRVRDSLAAGMFRGRWAKATAARRRSSWRSRSPVTGPGWPAPVTCRRRSASRPGSGAWRGSP